VELRDEVKELGVVLQRLEPVRATLRNVQRIASRRRQLHCRPMAVRRGVRAQIDGDVERGAARAGDELGLGLWSRLEVEAAQRAAWRVRREADLHRHEVDAALRKLPPAVSARESA